MTLARENIPTATIIALGELNVLMCKAKNVPSSEAPNINTPTIALRLSLNGLFLSLIISIVLICLYIFIRDRL